MAAPTDLDQWIRRSPSRKPSLFSRGLLAETFQPNLAGSGATIATQAVFGGIVDLYAGDVVTGIVFAITQAGSGTTPTSAFGGLLDLSGNRLALTATLIADASITGATGLTSAAFTTAYTVPTSGGYYPVFLQDGVFGTNTLQMLRITGGTSAGTALGSNALSAVTQTGRTSIANPSTLVTTVTLYYLGLY